MQLLPRRLAFRSLPTPAPARLAVWGLLVLTYAIGTLSSHAQAPGDFKVEAFCGSYAPWGQNQRLTIAPSGSVSYYESDLSVPGGDSLFVSISPAELEAIYDTVLAVSFFGLNNVYDSGAVDGSGIVLRITASGSTHSVEARNIAVSQLNRVVTTINTILAPDNIALNYGALNP